VILKPGIVQKIAELEMRLLGRGEGLHLFHKLNNVVLVVF
jgi:hypothetical protein